MTPTKEPPMKPGLRPKRRMRRATGTVEHMVPMTKVESGNVAQARDGASVVPTSPAVTNRPIAAAAIECAGDRQDDYGVLGDRSSPSRSMLRLCTPLRASK